MAWSSSMRPLRSDSTRVVKSRTVRSMLRGTVRSRTVRVRERYTWSQREEGMKRLFGLVSPSLDIGQSQADLASRENLIGVARAGRTSCYRPRSVVHGDQSLPWPDRTGRGTDRAGGKDQRACWSRIRLLHPVETTRLLVFLTEIEPDCRVRLKRLEGHIHEAD